MERWGGVSQEQEDFVNQAQPCSVLCVCPDGVAGYERYNAMRADPALCFLEKVGMPDEKLLSAEQGVNDGAQDAVERWAGDGTKLS